MRILRALLLVLVLVNLLLLAAAKGWLGGGSGAEPERLGDQLEAHRIVIVQAGTTPADAPAASGDAPAREASPPPAKADAVPPSTAPDVCRRYADLPKDKATRIAALAREAKVKVVQKTQDEPSSWWVHIPSQPNREEVDKRIAELRAAGVTDFFVVQESGPNHFAISLGLFKLEKMALDLRDKLRTKGVAQARVTPREGATSKTMVELRGAAGQLTALEEQVSAALPGLVAKGCAAPGPP